VSQQGLRRRVQELASSLHAAALGKYGTKADYDNASDLRALLAANKEAKRELAIVKSELRGIMCDSFSHSTNERIRAELKLKGVTL
jgi:hypothetical protein